MVESHSILLYPIYTDLERFLKETITGSAALAMYCFHQKMPVHCLLTVKEMTAENKSEGLVLVCVLVLCICSQCLW